MHKTLVLYLLLFTIAVFSSSGLAAESVKGCHCFKDRTYNPLAKFAADDYILATTFNSLLSKYFGISKKQIVLLKMQGSIGQDDLIIALSLSKLSVIPLEKILDLKNQKKTWQDVTADPMISNLQPSHTLQALRAGTVPSEVAINAANEIISSFFLIPPETVNQLRDKGLTEKELALLFILSSISGRSTEELELQHEQGGKSWSEIADSLGVMPVDAGKHILNFTQK
nr:hypothetical protein [Desulfobulbaceae bacterium]